MHKVEAQQGGAVELGKRVAGQQFGPVAEAAVVGVFAAAVDDDAVVAEMRNGVKRLK
jgi:hypothetical protein